MLDTTNKHHQHKLQEKGFMHPFTNLRAHEELGPVIIERGEGCWVWDDQGNKYLEGMASLWCANLGFNNERLINAAHEQMKKLPYFHNFTHKGTVPVSELTEKLLKLCPIDNGHVFYASSGSEANDTAIKMVWYYHNAIGKPDKKKIIAREKAYHGVTLGAASLSGIPSLHKDFDLPLPQMKHVSCPHFYKYGKEGETEDEYSTRLAKEIEDRILSEGPDTVAAFIAEPIMGAGGVFYPPKGYFEKVQPILKKYDVLMIADEVVFGFGRTGDWFGSDTFNIKPDIVTVAKGITAAYLPLSGTIISDKIYQAIADRAQENVTFAHGFTYSGHPVCAAVALEALKIYEEMDVPAVVRKVAPALQEPLKALADHPLVGNVRGVGLVGGVEIVKNKATKESFAFEQFIGKRVFEACHKKGVIIRAMGDVIGISPPLIVSEEECGIIMKALKEALDEVYTDVKAEGLM